MKSLFPQRIVTRLGLLNFALIGILLLALGFFLMTAHKTYSWSSRLLGQMEDISRNAQVGQLLGLNFANLLISLLSDPTGVDAGAIAAIDAQLAKFSSTLSEEESWTLSAFSSNLSDLVSTQTALTSQSAAVRYIGDDILLKMQMLDNTIDERIASTLISDDPTSPMLGDLQEQKVLNIGLRQAFADIARQVQSPTPPPPEHVAASLDGVRHRLVALGLIDRTLAARSRSLLSDVAEFRSAAESLVRARAYLTQSLQNAVHVQSQVQSLFRSADTAIAQSSKAIQHDLQRTLTVSLGAMLLVTLGGILIGATLGILIPRVLLPLRDAAEFAQALERGELDQRMPPGPQDEVGTLVRALNNMADQVQLRMGDMRAEIEERQRVEARLAGINAELKAKNEELERFTYTVSHDLKSPLITIKGFASALQDDLKSPPDEQVGEDIRFISEAADKMTALLDDLLALSRIGRVANPPELFPVAETVQSAMQLLSGPIRNRNVAVVVQPGLPTVFADKCRVAEVFQNLIENAVKYMGDQPTPAIEIGFSPSAGDSGALYVRDNGMGIPARYHTLVFGLFNKLEARSPGTGIGLALVRRIVEVHNGSIWVESEGAGGSTFFFTLPGAGGVAVESAPSPTDQP